MSLKRNYKKSFWLSGSGLAIVAIYLAAYVPLIIFFIDKYSSIYELEHTYQLNTPSLVVDSIAESSYGGYFEENDFLVDRIKFRIKLRNNSPDYCSILATITYDTTYNGDVIRKKILSKDTLGTITAEDTTFHETVIYSQESLWLDIECSVHNVFENAINYIHILIIYTNRIGGYYDLSLKQEFTYLFNEPAPMETYVDKSGKKFVKLPDIYDFTGRKSTEPYCYNLEEMKLIDFFLNRIPQTKR